MADCFRVEDVNLVTLAGIGDVGGEATASGGCSDLRVRPENGFSFNKVDCCLSPG